MNTILFKINDCFGDLDAPINYKWDKKIDDKYTIYEAEDDRLFEAISKSGQKASLACALIVFEGIVLRMAKDEDLLDMPQWLESLWAGIVDPSYIKSWDGNYKKFFITASEIKMRGALASSIFTLSLAIKRYKNKSYYFHNKLINLFLLFRHITPNRKVFDNWLSSILKKMAILAPCPYHYDDLDLDSDDEVEYDSSEEIILPREFFINQDYTYTESSARNKLQQFLQSLDFRNNPYLSSPDEMLSNGFKGEPYNL